MSMNINISTGGGGFCEYPETVDYYYEIGLEEKRRRFWHDLEKKYGKQITRDVFTYLYENTDYQGDKLKEKALRWLEYIRINNVKYSDNPKEKTQEMANSFYHLQNDNVTYKPWHDQSTVERIVTGLSILFNPSR